MTDHEWLKNLAQARLVDGQWTHADPEAVRALIGARVTEAVEDLFEAASAACAVFNLHAPAGRQIRALPSGAQHGSASAGFLLLMGRCQLRLDVKHERGQLALEVNLSDLAGFTRVLLKSQRLAPHVDPFGSVAWQTVATDNVLLMTQELIIKRMFEDLARAAPQAPAPAEGASSRSSPAARSGKSAFDSTKL